MNELKSYNSERIYWAVEQVEQEAGDIDGLHLDSDGSVLHVSISKTDNTTKEVWYGDGVTIDTSSIGRS